MFSRHSWACTMDETLHVSSNRHVQQALMSLHGGLGHTLDTLHAMQTHLVSSKSRSVFAHVSVSVRLVLGSLGEHQGSALCCCQHEGHVQLVPNSVHGRGHLTSPPIHLRQTCRLSGQPRDLDFQIGRELGTRCPSYTCGARDFCMARPSCGAFGNPRTPAARCLMCLPACHFKRKAPLRWPWIRADGCSRPSDEALATCS